MIVRRPPSEETQTYEHVDNNVKRCADIMGL
jgi:hypothetical protein